MTDNNMNNDRQPGADGEVPFKPVFPHDGSDEPTRKLGDVPPMPEPPTLHPDSSGNNEDAATQILSADTVAGSATSGDSFDPDNGGDDTMAPTPKKKKRLWINLALLLLVVVVVGGAVAYGVYYHDRALPRTTLGDVPVSGMKHGDIQAMVSDAQKDATITLTGDADATASLKDVGVTMDPEAAADDVLSANTKFGSYFKAPFVARHVEVPHLLDRGQLADYTHKLSTKVNPGSKRVIEPAVKPQKDNNGFTIVDGVDGSGLEPRDVQKVALSAMNTMKPASGAVKTVEHIKPLLSKKELEPIKEKADDFLDVPVVLNVGDEEVEAPREAKVKWVALPAPGILKDPTVAADNIEPWVAEEGGKLVVEPVNGYAYVSESGRTLKTEVDPVDGVKVTNVSDVSKELAQSMQKGKQATGTLETAVDEASTEKKTVADGAENLPYWASPGEVWIDINVSGRLLTVYKGADIIRGPMGMVPGDAAHPTVRGTFKIWHRTRVQTMEGPGYTTPNVEFNSFFHGSYAIHAAYWRSDFGPGTTGGSHGCVNMSRADAEWIWNNTNIGTVVVSRN